MVEAMEARYGLAQRIWVMDRGMTSEDNLEWLRETGRRYLIGTPKSELRKWAGALTEARDWHTVREGLEAKQCVGPDGVETFVLIRSVERREKERAMHERFARRIEALVHRPLFLAALDRADQHEGLHAVGPDTLFRFQPLAHRVPVPGLGERPRPLPELALGRPDQVPPPRLSEPLQVVLARHAAVHDPDPLGQAVARLHRLHHVLDRRHIGGGDGGALRPGPT